MRGDVYSQRHAFQKLVKNADQAEFAAIASTSAIVDQGVYDDRVADAMDDYDVGADADVERWERDDLAFDSAVGQAREEIERRVAIMGASYPFQLDGGSLVYTKSNSGFYEFCLAASLAEQITSGANVGFPRLFERLCALLVQEFFGPYAKSFHVGSPRQPDGHSQFGAAMRDAHLMTGEFIWSPDPDLPTDVTHTGDEGVDFIVWAKPPDQRIGSAFVLGQCACGDDWTEKFNDADLKRYRKWFNPLSYIEPLFAFATPYHVADGFLGEASRRAGLVFDRARLSILADAACGRVEFNERIPQMDELSKLVLPQLEDAG
ncbi:hypothetical protein DXH95_05940 [Sphingorhabdus pulchriflava]|uniref:Uncharacterized protein n=1 Tax=Sphingorhabdus pulchriflava TaxID=2292257 RepID=A0A371BHQ1_9SPHN|nr:hypothetical protein [Sphingorhabdus pulchriflava]RDV06933.1 hypothetical protein DXH95_05940 [Sphingorhabdus pulchriflava]